MLSRRRFLATTAAMPLASRLAAGGTARIKLGVMDGVLRMSGKPEAVALAKTFGCEGLQVTLGRPTTAGKLPLEDPGLQERFRAASAEHGVPIDSTYIDVLHADCLKDNLQAAEWVRRGIGVTRSLKARILMTVFFGKCALTTREEMDAAASAFRPLAPIAEQAGVILGFENVLNADDNLRVMEQVNSPSFKIWYDVGNSTNMVNVDAASEIRRLGRERICQLHFKDKGYLGEGKVDMPAVLRALGEIGYNGVATLETPAPSGSMEADLKRNLAYLRKLMA